MMCLCGKQYDSECRRETFYQITGAKCLDTSLLTNDIKRNKEIVKNPNNYYTSNITHGPIKTN